MNSFCIVKPFLSECAIVNMIALICHKGLCNNFPTLGGRAGKKNRIVARDFELLFETCDCPFGHCYELVASMVNAHNAFRKGVFYIIWNFVVDARWSGVKAYHKFLNHYKYRLQSIEV